MASDRRLERRPVTGNIIERIAPILGVPPRFEPPAQPFPLMSRLGAGRQMSPMTITLSDLFPEAQARPQPSFLSRDLHSDSRKVRPASSSWPCPARRSTGRALFPRRSRPARSRVVSEADRPHGLDEDIAFRERARRSPRPGVGGRPAPSAPARRIVTVTGTSGKSSVADFARQLFVVLGDGEHPRDNVANAVLLSRSEKPGNDAARIRPQFDRQALYIDGHK